MDVKDSDYRFNTGLRLDDFEIEMPIYKGILAEVYRAKDLLTRQTVAVKVPSQDVINHPLVFYHYQNEMRILARIRHPNVVGVVQRHRTSAYSVFEYIPGISLRQKLRRGQWMPLHPALDVAMQISRGLEHLHDCGIIHLDIKPDNILVTPAGQVKIIDFGLARQLGGVDLLYEDFARPHGTPDYVSPEQLAHHRDDPRTDQYSLTLVLYEMLTGRLPFERNQRLPAVRRRMKQAPLTPRRLRKEIPMALEDVILKGLSVDPGARYPSVADFGSALQSAGAVAGVHHQPATSTSLPTGTTGRPLSSSQCPLPESASMRPRVLAAVADDGKADAVADAALQAALVEDLPVTLLTVISGDAADDWIRYGDESRGKRLSRQLERLSLKFRHFGIDPSVRIRTGKPADMIIETAKALPAGLIVTGAARRRFFERFLGGGTVRKLINRSVCPVQTASRPRPVVFPETTNPGQLTHGEIGQAEIFLTSLWIDQVDWLATLVQSILTDASTITRLDVDGGPVERWLRPLNQNDAWAPLVSGAQRKCEQLQAFAGSMAAAARQGDLQQLCRIYQRDALPGICRLREALNGIADTLRRRAGLTVATRRSGLLQHPVCPLEGQHPTVSGPIQQLQALKWHFCGQAEANGSRPQMAADHGRDQPA